MHKVVDVLGSRYRAIKDLSARTLFVPRIGVFGILVGVLYFPIVVGCGLMIDDWGQLKTVRLPLLSQIEGFFPLWSNRPLAAILLTGYTRLIGEHQSVYMLVNSIVFITAIALLSSLIAKKFSSIASFVVFIVGIQPLIAEPVIYSPINQFTASFSILVWVSSLFLQDRWNSKENPRYWLIGTLNLVSLLIYEITLPLFVFNVIWPFITRGNNIRRAVTEASKISLYLLGAIGADFVWQKVIAPHVFSKVFSRLAPATWQQGQQILYQFFDVFIVQLQAMVLEARHRHIDAKLWIVLFLSIVLAIDILRNLKAKEHPKVGESILWLRTAIFVFPLLAASMLYVLSSSHPTMEGYDARGMTSAWIAFTVLLAVLIDRIACFQRVIAICVAIIVIMICSHIFTLRSREYVDATILRKSILEDFQRNYGAMPKKPDRLRIWANVPCMLPNAWRPTPIFCVPWDFAPALELTYGIYGVGAVVHAHNYQISNEEITVDGWFTGRVRGSLYYEFNPSVAKGRIEELNSSTDAKLKFSSMK